MRKSPGGPVCSVCIHPMRAELDALRGAVQLRKARALGVTKSTLDRHRKHAAFGAKAPAKPAPASLPPPPPAPTSERDALLDGLARLRQGFSKAETDDLPRIANAMTSISKRLEVLDEAREISLADIAKAPAFQELVARFAAALAPYPEAARAMAQVLALPK